MKSSRLNNSFATTVGEYDLDPDIYNEVGDVYGNSLPSEGTDVVETSNKKSSTTVPENVTDVSMAADDGSSCILRNLSFFELFDGETGEYVQLDDITQLRKSKGEQLLCVYGYGRRSQNISDH